MGWVEDTLNNIDNDRDRLYKLIDNTYRGLREMGYSASEATLVIIGMMRRAFPTGFIDLGVSWCAQIERELRGDSK